MKTFFSKITPYLYEGNKKTRLIIFIILLCFTFLSAHLVYYTGGTYLPYVHFLYIPVIISGFWLRFSNALFFAVFAGLILGPIMPLDVSQDTSQSTYAWVMRMGFFVIMGLLSSMAAQITRSYLKILKYRYLTDHETKMHNYKGLQALYKNKDQLSKLSGVIVVKLRQVKDVEKAFGIETISYVAVTTKERLKEILPKTTLGRISVDCFAICLESNDDALKIAYHLDQHIKRTFKFEKIPFLLEMYFGAVPNDKKQKESFKILIKKALLAVDHGIQNNLIVCQYHKETQDFSKRNIYILHELREALEQDQLSLNYQPIISLNKNKIVGMEALARWGHPELGMIPPLEFTQIAEKTQLINPYTKWLLEKSLSQLAKWRSQDIYFILSLNFSIKNFEDLSIVKMIYYFLEKYKIPPHMLEIEVTETAIAKNIGKTADILHSLRESGIKIAIDDFGTGQASLNYLLELPVDILKIDQVFVRSMFDNSASDAIIRSAIMMGHEMNLEIIAEGIETKRELDHLKKLGCDYGQGYHISRPMPVELATSWLDAKRDKLMKINI